MTTYLLKLGELTLKGGNRAEFETVLKRNLAAMLRGSRAVLNTTNGRFFVKCDESQEPKVEEVLGRLYGISGWAKAIPCEKRPEALMDVCVAEGKALAAAGVRSFKIEARRADKGFPLSSYEIMREAGAAVATAVPELRVDVKTPERVLEVEIREKAYVYCGEHRGRRGLPVGSGGKGLLLLSGGIDSPVAGYLMAGRGMRIEAIHFHSYPYTSLESQQKVAELARILGRYTMGVRLFTVPFTAVQLRIREGAPEAWGTVLLRMAMMEAADSLARLRKAKCLITGESLSQVASQTVENLRCTESRTTVPVLRPLIAIDKNATIGIAKEIGTYEISIQPFQDCCVLFSSAHPVLKGKESEASRLYESLELGGLISSALRERTMEHLGAYPTK